MKIRILLLLSIGFATTLSAQKVRNKIDSLKTDADVKAFLIGLDSSTYATCQILPVKALFSLSTYTRKQEAEIADSLKIGQPWHKVDLDKNGLTDLVCHLSLEARKNGLGFSPTVSSFIVYQNDEGAYKIHEFSLRLMERPYIIKVDTLSNQDIVLKLFQVKFLGDSTTTRMVVKNFGLAEYNSASKIDYHIEKVAFTTITCLNCQGVSITISKDKKAELEVRFKRNTENNGVFSCTLDDVHYRKIIDNLNYINFPSLCGKTNHPMVNGYKISMAITYNNGNVKNLFDYTDHVSGFSTRGLRNLYDLLLELQDNQKWVKK
jgi:hypothetical protein